MPPRTRNQSSGAASAASARSTRSATSRRSGGSASDASAGRAASTRASSVVSTSNSNSDGASSPTPADGGRHPLAPAPTPVDALVDGKGVQPLDNASLDASLDALYAPTARAINLVHMDHMAQYLAAAETQQSLDALLAVVKTKKSKPAAAGGGDSGTADSDTADPDYHTALDELDYLEGLFKKLRFSYKEQLTKETVVRRILELELPLLSAADIDRMVRDTEAERQHLRQIKSEGRAQGAAAERLLRDLAAERRYLAVAESETARLPDRVLRLRHRLARLKLALRAELAAIDRLGAGASSTAGSGSYPCAICGRSFHAEAFHQLHVAMHSVQGSTETDDDGQPHGVEDAGAADQNMLDFGGDAAAAAAVSATAMRRCRGCPELVPAVFLDDAPPEGETHAAFHARIRQTTAAVRETLAAAALASPAVASPAAAAAAPEQAVMGMAQPGEAEAVVRQLQRSEADLAALETRLRAEAERQAAIEGEMAQSLRHLRESVGSIRLEMARIEQEADRMVQYFEEGRTYLGRSLQEQTDLFDVLLLGDESKDDDDDDDGDGSGGEDDEAGKDEEMHDS